MHWRKLPYWIFMPVGLALCGGVALVWYHPSSSPVWAIWANLACQVLAIVLTAMLWGQWQAKLSKDPLGSRSPYLTTILATHWVRTLLINGDAFILLVWTLRVIE
jgi:membrane protein YdbS with pleckstrin-like domain